MRQQQLWHSQPCVLICYWHHSQISEWLKIAGLVSVYEHCNISTVIPLVQTDRGQLDKWVTMACELLVTKVRDEYFTALLPITLSRINRRAGWDEHGDVEHEIPLTRHFSVRDYKDSTVVQYMRVLRSLCLLPLRGCVENPQSDTKAYYGVDIRFTPEQQRAAAALYSLFDRRNDPSPDTSAVQQDIITAVFDLAKSVLFVALPGDNYDQSTFMRFVAFSLLSPTTRRPIAPRDAGVWLSSLHFVMKVVACAKVARDQPRGTGAGALPNQSQSNNEEIPLTE